MITRSPTREPMVWLMVGLPAASVVAGVLLVATAIRSGGADTVNDEVRRTAQIQQTDLSPDSRASSMGLSAVLRVEGSAIEVLPATGEFQRDQAILLILGHPTDAGQDRQLILRPGEQGWNVVGKLRRDHDWIVQLTSADRRWRLRGRWKSGERATRLAPALAVD
jgi:hypothetical protein